MAALPASVDLTLVLVGDGPLRPWLVSRVASDRALAARVQFEPHDVHDPVREIIGAADLYLRAKMGKAARGRFLATFEARGWALRLRGGYDEVLAHVPAEPVSRPVGSGPATLPPSFFDSR